jgi:predicted DsbA family dithiol-disulfide isomerase/uncharacterized membrane protein
MLARIRPFAAAALALAGLATSAALLVDSVRPAPAFCAAGGCAEVRASWWAHPLGIPMPAVGVTFFALALAFGCADAPRVRRGLALAGGAGAVLLLALQALVIGAWCRLCVATDLLAILHAALVVTGRRAWPPARRLRIAVTAIAAALAAAIPLAALRSRPQPLEPVTARALPDVVARAQVPGAAVVVDFVDFECPFCRAFHARLNGAIAAAGVPVRVVRVMVPLAQHEAALPAAVAWCCAENQAKGDQMAERLLTARDLSPAAIERIAADIGIDLDRFRADAASPAVRAHLEADAAAASAAGVRSLPTVYIGARRFIGAGASVDDLVEALRAAAG